MEARNTLTDIFDDLSLTMEPSHICRKKELTDLVKLHTLDNQDKCISEIIMGNGDPSECTATLQSKVESVPVNEIEETDKDSVIENDSRNHRACNTVSLPSTSNSQAQSTLYEKLQFETIDFMPKENILLRDIEYCIPIHFRVKENRNYYDASRPIVSCMDSKAFFNTTTSNFRFTILNYNILSQRLLLDNFFLYSGCTREFLEWKYRWNLLQHEIKTICPNILTLQEIDEEHYASHFLPWLSYYGYKGIYKKRTGNKKDGCAIFFKADMFKVLEHKYVQYRQQGSLILDRDNIGLIIKLTPIDFYQPFCVSTTHLLFNPKRPYIRLLQIVILLAELDRFSYTGEEEGVIQHCPVILTGDFNSDPTSALLRFLCQSKLNYDDLDATALSSAYEDPSVGVQLIPSSLDISNYCHHSALDKGRSLDRMRGSAYLLADRRKLEESLISLDKDCHQSPNTTPVVRNVSGSTGILYHRFKFGSVYNFTPEDVTTFHRSWVMVDYILYSQPEIDRKSRDSPLVLLSKYQLPDIFFVQRIGFLPCEFCPSDHFPLAATFALSKQDS